MRRRVLSLIGVAVLLGSLVVPQALIAQEPSPLPAESEPGPVPEQPAAVPETEAAAEEPSPAAGAPPAEQPPGPPAAQGAEAGSPVAVAAGSTTVTMVDFSFSPATVSVGVGDTVTWVNNGPDEQHTATAGDGSFDTGEIDVGGSASHTFTQPGSFAYICSLHPDDMKGTVQVADAGGGEDAGAAGQPSAPTGPGSEAAAGEVDDSGSGLPATGVPLGILLGCALALLAAGALTRRAR